MKPLRGTKAGKPMKVFVDETGRTRAVVDHTAIDAKLDVSTRLQKRKSRKITVVKRGGK